MTLPLSLPGVVVGAFLTFVLAIGDYITPRSSAAIASC